MKMYNVEKNGSVRFWSMDGIGRERKPRIRALKVANGIWRANYIMSMKEVLL